MLAASHILQAIAAAYIVVMAIAALTKMSPTTRHSVYLAYLALLSGAVLAFSSSFTNLDKFDFDCIFVAGVAMYIFVNRRPAPLEQRETA